MAKVSPISIKYMIHAVFEAEGALERPDVIGALFGQTEGLLGAELEMRELQKEGKIGRIEVELERRGKKTVGTIKIPTALDQSETTLIAAAIETIDRIGPCDSQITVEKIEDVRGSKREYIIERAKELLKKIEGSADSKEISNEIRSAIKISGLKEYGPEKVPCGDISGEEIIVVEGRADVINLLKHGIRNVIALNGTKIPESVKELSEKKEVTLFIDGDRGGKLIAENACRNMNVDYIAVAPDGKEVEELTNKEIIMHLRKKMPPEEFFSQKRFKRFEGSSGRQTKRRQTETDKLGKIVKESRGSEKAIILGAGFKEIKRVSIKSLAILHQLILRWTSRVFNRFLALAFYSISVFLFEVYSLKEKSLNLKGSF